MSKYQSRPAPIALMIYRRPEHLRRTLTSLRSCNHFASHDIHVFGDGPKTSAEIAAVKASRAVATEMLGSTAQYHFSQSNRGLSKSVIAATDQLTMEYGDVIVLEDDLVLAPEALDFLQRGLNQYRHEDQIMQISAYMFNVSELDLPAKNEAIFLPFTTSWGWATWQRAWVKFDAAATGWQTLQRDKKLRRRFNIEGAYDFHSMMKAQMQGKRDSWAIRWYWSVFKANGLVAYPPRTLVENSGFDGSGTHGNSVLRRFSVNDTSKMQGEILFNNRVEIDNNTYARICKLIYKQNGGLVGKIVDKLKRLIKH